MMLQGNETIVMFYQCPQVPHSFWGLLRFLIGKLSSSFCADEKDKAQRGL
jgi:hypothetical protein